MIRTSRLDSGLRVVTERMPDVRSVAIGFWVAVGSRDEDDEVAGVSHFLEHLLFKGTDRWSGRAIAEVIDESGGEMNAFTGKEYTAFYVRVLDDRLATALDILTDIIWSPAFRSHEVEAERQVILEELLLHGDEPDDAVHDLLFDVLFPGHPLGREVLGTEASITGLTRDAIRAFHASEYRADRVVLAAAGAIDHDAVVSAVATAPARPRGAEHPPRRRTAPDPARPGVVVHPEDTEQAHLTVGMRAPARDDADRYAAALLEQVLGGGMSSRLFQEVREQRGLAYSVYSSRAAFADSGALTVYAGTAPSRALETLEVIHGELDRLARFGVTQRELAVAKANVRGSTYLGLEDTTARMSRIARSLLLHDEVLTVEEVLARYDAVGVDDIRRIASRILGGPRAVAVIGPFDAAQFGSCQG